MSTSQKRTFAVWAPDYTDDEAPQRRQAVRPLHLENAKSLIERGIARTGGPLLTTDTYLSENPKMVGSMLVLQLESIEEAWNVIKKDVFYTGNVWDKEKIQVLPFNPVVWLS